MNDLIKKDKVDVESMIYEIRGKQVMLDSDLAKLYQCSNGTKTINQAVKRHIKRFPERFMFQLTKIEYEMILRSQFGTLELEPGKYSKYLPYVFTEQGVAMLATVLRTAVAEEVSIQIMDAFVALRKYISNNLIEQKYINNQVFKNTEDIRLLQESFSKLESKEVKNEIYFNGQIYDAYFKIIDIMNDTSEELIVIDNYADKTFLDMIRNFSFKVILITRVNSKLSDLDISKYNSEYNNLSIIYDNTFHDRYFILDKKIIYHCGASINHAGSKTFSINKLEDKFLIDSLLSRIVEIIS